MKIDTLSLVIGLIVGPILFSVFSLLLNKLLNRSGDKLADNPELKKVGDEEESEKVE